MVTNDTRNNLIVIALIVGIAGMTIFSMSTFANQMTTTGQKTEQVITETATDINATLSDLIKTIELQANVTAELAGLKAQELEVFEAGFDNLSTVVNEQLILTKDEREIQANNLALFLETFQNNSDTLVNATNIQTEKFIEVLQKSQNLTMKGQNLTLNTQNLTKNLTAEIEFLNKLLDQYRQANATIDAAFTPNTTRLLTNESVTG